MPSKLSGKSFNWVSYDQAGVISALIHEILLDWFYGREVNQRFVAADSPMAVAETAAHQTTAWAVWVLRTVDELGSCCESIDRLRRDTPGTKRICFLRSDLQIYLPIVLEAGAQIAVTDIPSLQNALLHQLSAIPLGGPLVGEVGCGMESSDVELDSVPLSDDGFHPLTTGLLRRLPWPELDGD